eukprot:NODE_186_length_2773_cov_25.048375_g172_i0.p1 GENE.NODE_186_length_2773_cov_25.048375_g172_i0~~NODE_186_length_2773_cov_25.048375_g172_i0.p1  ORF type:complete len:912 (-),score=270.42 NODE_186_length_2773_cov_25.048375_g172_i0:22-2757(-)
MAKSKPTALAGKYSIDLTSPVGQGANGVVYVGHHLERLHQVAVKAIPLGSLSATHVDDLKNEIDLLKCLKHKHIVHYWDHEQTRDHIYIMMELMEGSIVSLLKRNGLFSEDTTQHYTTQILLGLKYLHKEGVIHRDIKGDNLLIKGDLVKLADFGVACLMREEASDTTVPGTPYWMAPEIIQLFPASYASDIWSFACTVIEMLTGAPPHFELLPLQALYRIVQSPHPPLPEDTSQGCREFLLRCFRREAQQRPTAAQLLEDVWLTHSAYSERPGHGEHTGGTKQSSSPSDPGREVDEWLVCVELQQATVIDVPEPSASKENSQTESTDPDNDTVEIDLACDLQVLKESGLVRTQSLHHRRSVDECLATMNPGADVPQLVASCKHLMDVFTSTPRARDHFIRQHGIFCIIELLEVNSPDVVLSILQLVNQLTCDKTAVLESLCYIGVLPIIGRLTHSDQPVTIRTEVCTFLTRLLKCSVAILDMFVLSNGMRCLVELLRLPLTVDGMVTCQHVFAHCRACPQMAVEAIHQLLAQKLRVSHNHLCVLLVVNGIGEPLSLVTYLFLNEQRPPSPRRTDTLDTLLRVWTFLTSCTANCHSADVRPRLSTPSVVHRLFDCVRLLPPKDKVRLLNCVFYLTQSSDLGNISNAGCIVELISVLDDVASHGSEAELLEIESVVVSSLFNLTKVHASRDNWEQAATAGLVPHLKRLVSTAAVHMALPMLCDMVCIGGAAVRHQLWQHGVLDFLLGSLSLECCTSFQLSILNSINSWLHVKDTAESKRVQVHVRRQLSTLAHVMAEAWHTHAYPSVVEVLAWLCAVSDIADGFGNCEPCMSHLIQSLQRSSPHSAVRLNLLKILSRVFEWSLAPKALLTTHTQLGACVEVYLTDPSQLVRANATKLLNAFLSVGKVSGLTL